MESTDGKGVGCGTSDQTNVAGGPRSRSDSGVDDLEEFKVPLETPVVAPKQAKSSTRRSMLNITRRQSKSMMAGIPFEDQVGAISDPSRSIGERLCSLARISLSATTRGIQEALQEEGAEDPEIDAAQQVSSHLRKTVRPEEMGDDALEKLASSVSSLGKQQNGSRMNESLMLPSKVRCIRNYVSDLNAESTAWRNLLNQRKEEYSRVRAEKKAVVAGEKKLSEEDLPSEAASDPSLTSEFAARALSRLKEQEEELKVCAGLLERRQRGAKKRLLEAEAELDAATRKIISRSEEMNNVETGLLAEAAKKHKADLSVHLLAGLVNGK